MKNHVFSRVFKTVLHMMWSHIVVDQEFTSCLGCIPDFHRCNPLNHWTTYLVFVVGIWVHCASRYKEAFLSCYLWLSDNTYIPTQPKECLPNAIFKCVVVFDDDYGNDDVAQVLPATAQFLTTIALCFSINSRDNTLYKHLQTCNEYWRTWTWTLTLHTHDRTIATLSDQRTK